MRHVEFYCLNDAGPQDSCHCEQAGELTIYTRGRYRYMDDLRILGDRRPATEPKIPMGVGVVATPLRTEVWEVERAAHPDREFARFVVKGIWAGFRIGFDYSRRVSGSPRNMPSASEHPELIDRYVEEEVKAGLI